MGVGAVLLLVTPFVSGAGPYLRYVFAMGSGFSQWQEEESLLMRSLMGIDSGVKVTSRGGFPVEVCQGPVTAVTDRDGIR